MILPRRIFRAIAYTVVFFATTCFLLLVANKHDYININGIVPYYLTPAFFQPPSGSYIIDIEIGQCLKLNGNNANCGVPKSKDGFNGDLGELGGWIRVDKDLALGSSLLYKHYLSYKVIKDDAFKEKDGAEKYDKHVITDIAVFHESDGKIEGNKNRFPLRILHEFRNGDVYDDEDNDFYASKGLKGELYKEDSDKHRASVGNKQWLDKEDQKQKQIEKEQQKENSELGEEDPEPVKENKKAKDKSKSKSDKPKSSKAKDKSKDGKATPHKESEQIQDKKVNFEPEDDVAMADTKHKPPVSEEEAQALQEAEAEVEAEADEAEVDKEEQIAEHKAQFDQDEPEVEPDVEVEVEEEGTPKLRKRKVETDLKALEVRYQIPSGAEVEESGWIHKSHGIWVKYAPYTTHKGLTAIDVLFGKDAVDPRPNWHFLKRTPVMQVAHEKGREPYISYRRGPKVDYKSEYPTTLKVDKDGRFKILQVADLHFSTGVGKCRDPSPIESGKDCEADPRTLKFLERVLDLEKPDLVVLSGDQVFGDAAPDSETALFKAVDPFIKRKIPFATTLGNHDDEGSMPRNEMMSLLSTLPYSLAANGPEEVAGFGNYVVNVQAHSNKNSAILLYFLDSHKYSTNPKVNPGYDWIKDSQLAFVEREYASFQKSIEAFSGTHLSMAFFHIPLPEYRNLNQPYIGEKREGITAPKYNTGARKTFGDIGVKAISVGHDHCNDYCLEDSLGKDDLDPNKMWLCYGGGVGEGGYGGYGGYVRRLRSFWFDTVDEGEITTWKRLESDPDTIVDTQFIASNIVAVKQLDNMDYTLVN